MISIIRTISHFLNDSVMGFFALVALATALGPMVFDVSPAVEHALTLLEWALVAMFATEVVIQGLSAGNRREWLRSPWRIVDAITVLGPFLALLPQVSDVASSSLMLRMLRVVRAVAFGTRAGSVAVRRSDDDDWATVGHEPSVSALGPNAKVPVAVDWDSFLAWTRRPDASWMHATHLTRTRFEQLAESALVSTQEIDRLLAEDAHARLRDGRPHGTLLLQVPAIRDSGVVEVRRDRLLAVTTEAGILTATSGSLDLHEALEALSRATPLPDLPLPARVITALLTLAKDRNVAIAQRFDEEARRLEALEGGSVFLRESFRLRKELSTAVLDVWHLKGIVRALADGKAKLQGTTVRDEKYYDDLLAETDSLYERLSKSKEEIKTLIELHINFKSFEMNVFLKLLAVVSFMGLIPSVVGGLLGMNVLGNPWPVTLGQVAFGIAMAMATALYVFAVKGWLR